MTCPRCQADNPRAARYCQQCGRRFGPPCSRCQAATWPTARYCTECGEALAPSVAAVPVARPAAPLTALPEERRPITVLFADVVGFTSLSERLDPEEVRDLMRDLFRELAAVVRQHGGWIEKYIGDALVGVFGARVAREDDVDQALYCALDLHRATAERSAALALPTGEPLRLRVGVNTGLAVVGAVGGDEDSDFGVTGDTVNTAARLQSAAEPEHTIVGEATWRAAQRHFAFAGPRLLQLKGKAAPVLGYPLLGPRTAVDAADEQGPLFGRETEVAALTDAVAAVAAGQGFIAFIVGDTGIGKTRLLVAAGAAARARGLMWVPAQGQPHRQQVPGGIFQEAVRHLLGLPEQTATGDDGDKQALAQRLRERLVGLGCEEAYPFLAPRLGLAEPELPAELQGLPREALRARVAAIVERLWEAVSREQPQVVAVDDLHWADLSSLAVLERLLALTERAPLGLVFTLRTDAGGPAAALRERALREFPHRCLDLTLGPLGREDSTRLVRRVLGTDTLAPGVTTLIHERAAGNPLYVEEITRGLIESGALVRDGAGWALSASGEAAVPPTLQATLLARLDRLVDATRRLLQIASVAGQEWALDVVTSVLAAAGDASAAAAADASLLEAQRAGLIEAIPDPVRRRYRFRHGLLRDAAYGTLLLRRRRELHRLVAERLQAGVTDPAQAPVELLAMHYAAAEQWPEAQAAATAAARRAEAAVAYREAAAQWEGAVRAAGHRDGAVAPAERAALAEAWGQALVHLGEWQAAREAFEQGIAAWMTEPPAARREPRARLLVALAGAALRQTDTAAAGSALTAALPALDPSQPLLSTALSLEAQVYLQNGHLDSAAASARRALDLALRVGGPAEQAEAYATLAHPSLAGIIGRQACEYSQRGVALARELGDPARLLTALVARSIVEFVLVGSATAASAADAAEALKVAEGLRAPALVRTARGILGVVEFLRGDWEAAARDMTTALSVRAEEGPYSAYVRFWLGLLHTWRGELAVGRGWLEEGLARARIVHAPIWLHSGLAVNARLAGDATAARAALDRAQMAATEHRCAACQALYAMIASEEFAMLGDADAARNCVAIGLEEDRALGRAATELSARRALARLALAADDPAAALTELTPALRLAESLESPHERARTALLAGQARLARGRRGDRAAARALAESAQVTFERLGAAPEAAECAALLAELGARAASRGAPAPLAAAGT